jgi:hypothetical protein
MLRLPLLMALFILLASCGTATPATDSSSSIQSASADLVPVVAASELEVGRPRLPLGILQNGTPINDPELTLTLRFFYLDGSEQDTVQSETQAVYRGEGLPVGLYVAYPTLDKAGGWGMEVEIPNASGAPSLKRVRLDVVETSSVPAVGQVAIASDTLTVSDIGDLKQLSSDAQPDADFYQLSITDALAANKPFVVAFATPGYCQTAVCSPNMTVLKQLKQEFGERMNFIHVEVYPYPFGESFQQQKRVAAMDEWNLRTEPWTYLVDAEGLIQAKYEGGITLSELRPALAQLAAGETVAPVQ